MINSAIANFSSMSQVNAKVELYSGSTLATTCTCSNYLQDFTIHREGESSKFFGFGICHKLTLNLIDFDGNLEVNNNTSIKICLGSLAQDVWDTPYPMFYADEVIRDKKNKTIQVTAYDALNKLSKHTFSELNLTAPYTLRTVYNSILSFVGLSQRGQLPSSPNWELNYEDGANFDGTEPLRDVMNQIAEVTCMVYSLGVATVRQEVPNTDGLICVAMSDSNKTINKTISKNDYYELSVQDLLTLTGVCHATDLEDNLMAGTNDGAVHYIRNNAFLDLRTDLPDILDNIEAAVHGLTMLPYELDWEGDYRLECGDIISIETDEGTYVSTTLLCDTITYGGTLNEISRWSYENSDETATNPTTIREVFNKTFARVDKLEKNITLYVGEVVDTVVTEVLPEQIEELTGGLVTEVDGIKATQTVLQDSVTQLQLTTEGITQSVEETETRIINIESAVDENNLAIQVNTSNIGSLQVKSNSINATVQSLQETTTTSMNGMHEEIVELTQKVDAQITSEDVTLRITEALNNGVDQVTTSTGFTFNDEGLHISKSNSEMTSLLDETGLEVSRYSTPVLTAKSDGVNALNITVRQFLNVGGSRFEKYKYNRTGCFWIGD